MADLEPYRVHGARRSGSRSHRPKEGRRYHAAELAQVRPGETVVVMGPVRWRGSAEATGGDGAGKGIDAVAYQAAVPEGEEQPALVLNRLIEAVRATGRIGVAGLYLTDDPGAPDRRTGRRPGAGAPAAERPPQRARPEPASGTPDPLGGSGHSDRSRASRLPGARPGALRP